MLSCLRTLLTFTRLLKSIDPAVRKLIEKVVIYGPTAADHDVHILSKAVSNMILQHKGSSLKLQDRKAASESSVSGLAIAPQRAGLGLPRRPAAPMSRRIQVQSTNPPSPVVSMPKPNSIMSPNLSAIRSQSNTISSYSPSTRSQINNFASSPRLAAGKKILVIDQLSHSDALVRTEGIVAVACILRKQPPPGYEGQKLPQLPPPDILGPTLLRLLNDPDNHVIEQLLSPEVIPEICKVINAEQIVPRVLLFVEEENEQTGVNPDPALSAIKAQFKQAEAAEMLAKMLIGMGVSGIVPRKLAVATNFSTTQKRKILHSLLLWMNDLVEQHNLQKAQELPINEYFADINNYKQYIHRLVPMVANTKSTSNNYLPLINLLRSLQAVDFSSFERVLQTFEKSTVNELRRAWGQTIDDTEDAHLDEEKIADVEEVLGSVPQVGGVIASPTVPVENRCSFDLMPPPMVPDLRARTYPNIPTDNADICHHDEELTIIGLPQLLRQVPLPLVISSATSNGQHNKENAGLRVEEEQSAERLSKDMQENVETLKAPSSTLSNERTSNATAEVTQRMSDLDSKLKKCNALG